MPRSVTVNKANTVLPNGEIYQVGHTVLLTDDEWASINPALVPGTLIDNGEAPDPLQGPPGPQGPPGITIIGEGAYVHVQEEPSDMWVINHGLPYRPGGIYVEDTGGTNVEGDLAYPEPGVITISFSTAFAGKAYLS